MYTMLNRFLETESIGKKSYQKHKLSSALSPTLHLFYFTIEMPIRACVCVDIFYAIYQIFVIVQQD